MTEPEALQELREALARASIRKFHPEYDEAQVEKLLNLRREHFMSQADAVIEAIRGAGWGPTAAHEACIKRLWGEGWGVRLIDSQWSWIKDGQIEPMTEQEAEVMGHG